MFPLYDLNPHRRIPWLTVLIIVANLVVTGWMSGLDPNDGNVAAVRYGFVPKRLSDIGGQKPLVVAIPKVNQWGQPIPNADPILIPLSEEPSTVYMTFFTAMFMHGGWAHVLSNMWILWIFGNNIEDRLGHFMY